jgi:23S rRNA-intervening sequence protein
MNGDHVQASLPITDANATIFIGGISMGQSYRDLIAWQKAMTLVTEVYVATRRFPGAERYGHTKPASKSCRLDPE